MDVTFRGNAQVGRHGWLRLTPAYSVGLVGSILDEFAGEKAVVLDPFSGTGTTVLCAAERGLRGVGVDVNPFLVWLGGVKVGRYGEGVGERVLGAVEGVGSGGWEPEMRNLDRWWTRRVREVLGGLLGVAERCGGVEGDLLRVVLCRTLIACSGAAFDHPSMSFRREGARDLTRDEVVGQARRDAEYVVGGLGSNPCGEAQVDLGDARGLGGIGVGEVDVLVTSPPYANRMSYVRELRPYMYWLGYLRGTGAAGELDAQAVGGTWGSATSGLLRWRPSGAWVPESVLAVVEQVRRESEVLGRYVHRYFDDMGQHFTAAARVVRPGGTVHYVVGNSAFYGRYVPVPEAYAEQLERAGFRQVEVRRLRARGSRRGLYEAHVVGRRGS